MMRLLILIALLFNVLFPSSVNQAVATQVASNLFVERGDGENFDVRSVDLISEDSYDLFYIFYHSIVIQFCTI